ncbi:hypothetical protein BGZ61DRAFT_319920, partial [Ilyonectria robusta]|uniref:uncharacterized protein n=1 Tax=Ilyonectria robusta TaxID=1079257 RepID=UPI001E8D7A80
ATGLPMLSCGITTFSLKRDGAEPGKGVGMIGHGGLGHFESWATNLGCIKAVSVSQSSAKRNAAGNIGESNVIATGESNYLSQEPAGMLDIIVYTAS